MIIPQTEESLAAAAQVISGGGVIAFRTDTFYGLGSDPFNNDAVARINELKGREEGKPILIVISDQDQAARFLTGRSEAYRLLANDFWPGPLTLVVRAQPAVPEELTAGTETIGVRLPADDQVRNLVRACGGALTATSANKSGEMPARTATQVLATFSRGVDLIIDGGEVDAILPSTVIDLTTTPPSLIREGAGSWIDIQRALRKLPWHGDETKSATKSRRDGEK